LNFIFLEKLIIYLYNLLNIILIKENYIVKLSLKAILESIKKHSLIYIGLAKSSSYSSSSFDKSFDFSPKALDIFVLKIYKTFFYLIFIIYLNGLSMHSNLNFLSLIILNLNILS
jgi:hypothetical protein